MSGLAAIAAQRQRQPIKELQRKMQKAGNTRARLWTQEELDYADAIAAKLHGRLNQCDQAQIKCEAKP